mgnify:CR=1 FL=1
MSSTLRGLAPHEGLELPMTKLAHTRPLMDPSRGPQAGKSRYPHSQDADSSPRAQGVLVLGFEAKPNGNYGAPRSPTVCGLG